MRSAGESDGERDAGPDPDRRWSVKRRWTAIRATHAVRVLRWLRNLMLLAIVGTYLLCLGVAVSAHHRISGANQTAHAAADVGVAYTEAQRASDALGHAFAVGDPALSGTGSDFDDSAAKADVYILRAVGDGGAAGARGSQELEFVYGQLITCRSLADTAVREFDKLGKAAVSSASSCLTDPDQPVPAKTILVPDTGGLTAALADLDNLENQALAGQRSSAWLHPLRFVWVLLVPTFLMLALLIGTGFVLARWFHRFISPLLYLATLLTAAVVIVFSVMSAHDDATLSTNPWAVRSAVVTGEGLVLLAALICTYFGYRQRIAEYRFSGR